MNIMMQEIDLRRVEGLNISPCKVSNINEEYGEINILTDDKSILMTLKLPLQQYKELFDVE